MITQIINLSFTDVFKIFSERYNIYRDVYQKDLLALEIRGIQNKLAEIIKKVVLHEKQICYRANKDDEYSNLLVPGSLSNLKDISHKILSLGDEDLGYRIIKVIKNFEESDNIIYKIGERKFDFKNSYVMGILNVTPDSFSDGGLYNNLNDAVTHGIEMLNSGADILDIGGESSRPGADSVTAEEEIQRIIPVIDQILAVHPDAIISVDTTKLKVAETSLAHGAKIINDISGASFEPEILQAVKKYNAAIVLMHIKGTPKTMQKNPVYHDVTAEVFDSLYESATKAVKTGIKKIIIDPGIGFGKTIQHNFELLRRLEDFKSLGYPILIGVSRKSFIGKTLELTTEDRDFPTAVVETAAIKNGAKIIRTHNVPNGVKVCKLLNQLT